MRHVVWNGLPPSCPGLASSFLPSRLNPLAVFRASTLHLCTVKSLQQSRRHQLLTSTVCTAANADRPVIQQKESRKTSVIGDIASQQTGLARVVLKKGKANLFRDGNPTVYSGAIDRVVGRPPPRTGDSVLVADPNEQPIAWGVFNSVSMFRVRLMQTEADAKRDPSCVFNMERLISTRVKEAAALRQALGLPNPGTTDVYRLINSEGDRLSGVIADVLGSHVVVASSAAWAERYRPEITTAVLQAAPHCSSLIWRPSVEMLREEGLEDIQEGNGAVTPGEATSGDHEVSGQEVEVSENGVRYRAALAGQKTGFYADQRESRKVLRSVCGRKRVLDLCCYSGGFALNAALGGAAHVIGVDSSGPALLLANENAALNGLDAARCQFEQADIGEFMQRALAEGQSWDVVVLDPPKLAPNRKVLQRAAARYRRLNALAMRLVTPGGLLMTCSCSGAVTQSGIFSSILQEAAATAQRRIRVVRTAGAGPDHPLDLGYSEGAYLTNVLVHVL